MRFLTKLVLACFWASAVFAEAQVDLPATLKPGTRLERLETRTKVYEQVLVKSLSARTLGIQHKGGLASLPLRDLPPALQALAGYDPVKAAEEEEAIERRRSETAARKLESSAQKPSEQSRQHLARYEAVIQSFSLEPELRAEVDLRPSFFQLELGVKSQGRRPSCAVFAVLGAVEYLNAEQTGKAEKFSEEYLVWATLRTVNRRLPGEKPGEDTEEFVNTDAGFALEEVVAALRGYGVPPLSAMPNTLGLAMHAIPEPPPEVVQLARTHRRVFVHAIPGRTPAQAIANLAKVLNAGIPIPIGLRWPNSRSLYRSGFLSDQKPVLGYAHAVTLVGYRCPTGKLEDLVFIFRNSYGSDWGSGGYGQAAYRYLERNLLGGVLIEVQ